ncbi:MAG: efflux RND transporter permease subunit [Acidobacteriota bacterium]
MIPRFAVSHPVTVLMIFAAAALLGYLSLRELPVDLLPELQAPRIAVLVRAGDRPPEELEDRYAEYLEAQLSTLPDVRSVRTTCATGRVLVTIEQDWDTEMDFALLQVEKRVSILRTDRDVDSVTVSRFDPSDEPVVVLALSLKGDAEDELVELDRLRLLAEDRVARILETVEGVASVQVAGGRQARVGVVAERHRLRALGLSFDGLRGNISAGNAEASGGTVEDGGKVHVIKGLGRFHAIEDIAGLPVQGSGDGSKPRRLDEVATVEWESAPLSGLVTVDGKEGLSLSIFKEADANTVAVSDAVTAAVAEIAPQLTDANLQVVTDQATFIREAITQVQWAALAGIVLAIFVLLVFLRRLVAVVLVALAIPLSVVTTLALMGLADLSLNLMTLGGLALGAGMLIDNAIVVLEAIVARLEGGSSPREAAIEGASEVAAAIFAATLTTCVVFVPVAFLEGLAAELFTDLAFTVAFSLIASLGVALLLLPMAAARFFKARGGRTGGAGRGASTFRGLLRRPFLIVLVTGVLLFFGWQRAQRLGLDFLPTADPGLVVVELLLPEGHRVTVTREAARVLEDALTQSVGSAVATTLAELGESVREEIALTDEVPSQNRGLLRIRLVPREERNVTTEQVIGLLEKAAESVEGLSIRFRPTDPVLSRLLDRGPPIAFELRGQELDALEEGCRRLSEELAKQESVFNVRHGFEDRRAELRLQVDRIMAAGLGLTPDQLGERLRQRLGDQAVTDFRDKGELRNVVLRAPRLDLDGLSNIVLDTPSGEPVRLRDIARLEVVTAPTQVERRPGTRTARVTAQVLPGESLGGASAEAYERLTAVPLPPGLQLEQVGAEKERAESFRQLLFAVALAIALVYMVLASLFESLVHPFTILFTLPTAGLGVIAALDLAQTPFSVPALLGAVMLAGIAVNNGILLVDLTGQLRRRGLSRLDAVVAASSARLRPILMTSLTTVLAMLPLALPAEVLSQVPGLALGGEGSELRAPMALTVIGGLLASTVLTLVLVPAVYLLLDRLRPNAETQSVSGTAVEPLPEPMSGPGTED